MNKKQVEKYLMLYPEIDREIERLQNDLEYYASEKDKYQKKAIPEENRKSMIEIIDKAYHDTLSELQELIQAKQKIRKILNTATPLQRKIIEFRFWQNQRVKWTAVADEVNYHPKSVERIYGELVKLVT